jgi:hypothetical protein
MSMQYSYGRPRADLREALTEFNPGQGFVTTQVLPVLPVKLKSANITVMRRENYKTVNVDMRDGDAFPRINIYAEDANYTCKKRGLESPLTQTEIATYGSDFDVEVATVGLIEQLLMIQQEARAAAALFNTTTFTGSALYTDNSASPWDTAATDIIAQVLAAKEKVRLNTGFQPDSMLIGAVTMCNLLKNTGIKNQFPGAPLITEAMIRAALAPIFGLLNLYVGNAVYDSAKEGQTFVGADIWADDYALIFKKNEGSPKSGGLGRTILWTELTPDNATVDQYIEKQSESVIYRVKHFVEEKLFDPYFGHLLKIDA